MDEISDLSLDEHNNGITEGEVEGKGLVSKSLDEVAVEVVEWKKGSERMIRRHT